MPRRLRTTLPRACVVLAQAEASGRAAADVVYEPVPQSARWADAVDPGALRVACARDEREFHSLFAGEKLPFAPELVRHETRFPRFGLGEVEDRLFRELGAQLPGGYSVVPIEAQRVLIRNGGLHCLAGLVR